MSFWNSILLPAGVEAEISVGELEINSSALLVCSTQLTLPVSVLLHFSPPTELLGELEFSASTGFSKIRFVTSHNVEASYSRPLLTKVKSTPWRLDLANWGPLHIMSLPPRFPSPVWDDLIVLVYSASSQAGIVVPLLLQQWPQGFMLSGAKRLHVCKSTCRPWENHCCGNDMILAGISREILKYQTCLHCDFLLTALCKLWVGPCVCSGTVMLTVLWWYRTA